MFWSFFLQNGNYYPAMFPVVLPSNSTLPEPSISPSVDQPPSVEEKKKKVIKLNLTEEDLLRAGYETNKKPWAEEEDIKLLHLREKEQLDWTTISSQIEGRNAKMCYSRYRRLENQTKNLWRQAENEKLCELVEEYGEDWKKISKAF